MMGRRDRRQFKFLAGYIESIKSGLERFDEQQITAYFHRSDGVAEGNLLLFRVQNINNDTLTDQQRKFFRLVERGLAQITLMNSCTPLDKSAFREFPQC